MADATSQSLVGCKITLITRSDIKYEGYLDYIDGKGNEVGLTQVRMLGTEGRRAPKGERDIAPGPQVYESVSFRGTDIMDLKVDQQRKLGDDNAGAAPRASAAPPSFQNTASKAASGTSAAAPVASSRPPAQAPVRGFNNNGNTNSFDSLQRPMYDSFDRDRSDTRAERTGSSRAANGGYDRPRGEERRDNRRSDARRRDDPYEERYDDRRGNERSHRDDDRERYERRPTTRQSGERDRYDDRPRRDYRQDDRGPRRDYREERPARREGGYARRDDRDGRRDDRDRRDAPRRDDGRRNAGPRNDRGGQNRQGGGGSSNRNAAAGGGYRNRHDGRAQKSNPEEVERLKKEVEQPFDLTAQNSADAEVVEALRAVLPKAAKYVKASFFDSLPTETQEQGEFTAEARQEQTDKNKATFGEDAVNALRHNRRGRGGRGGRGRGGHRGRGGNRSVGGAQGGAGKA